MLKNTQKWLADYLNELDNINFMQFNRFIITKILANALKFNTILPVLIAIGVVAFSLAMQDGYYIFIPQSSITAFASYVIFACVSSVLVLVLYPLVIILFLNYVGNKIKPLLNKAFFPFKVLVLIAGFFICIRIMSSANFSMVSRIYITGLWTLFYFMLVNLYISYSNNNGIIKFSRFRIFFALVFVGLLVKPFLIMFIYTSQMINYTSINSKVYLSQTNCDLITSPIGDKDRSNNMAVFNPTYFESVAGGCRLLNNTIRYGFGGDYVLIFKKNINPIINSQNEGYNAYLRLTCYAGNCYSQDNFFTLSAKDSQSNLIMQDMARKKRKMKSID